MTVTELGFDNYEIVDFTLSRELTEVRPVDGWKCWEPKKEIILNITLKNEL